VKYAVEMGSGAVICLLCFIKTGSGIQKFDCLGGGIHKTHRQRGFQNKAKFEIRYLLSEIVCCSAEHRWLLDVEQERIPSH
jgi:hypothetical protein